MRGVCNAEVGHAVGMRVGVLSSSEGQGNLLLGNVHQQRLKDRKEQDKN